MAMLNDRCVAESVSRNFALKDRSASGFTLVELAVVIIILGALTFGVFALLRPLVQNFRHVETAEKMEKISRILNRYAIENYRLPCPAEPNRAAVNPPYGFQSGGGADGAAIPNICPTTEGIIPFRAMGVPESLAVDGFGNYFTYAISPAFSQNTYNDLPATVHPACRTADWFYDEGKNNGTRVMRNINPRKARFCCPGTPAQGTDLNILDENSSNVMGIVRAPGPDDYQTPDTLMRPVNFSTGALINTTGGEYYLAPQVPPANARATAPAYILISHGMNGLGAFLPGSNTRNTLPTTAQELENADGDNTYFDTKTRSTNVVTRFDDLILWRTQDAIFAEEGESCSVP